MSNWKNRIVRTGEQPAGEFLANPGNWRVHPKNQRDALRGVLGEVGWVTGVIVNKTTGHMLDGHARVEEALKLGDETPVPFIEVELTEAEEKTVLATFDPISAMAAADKEQLDALLRDVSTASEGVQSMLSELAEKSGLEYGSQIGGTLEDAEPQIDKAAELARKLGTARGQVWRLGEHRLLCGDSTRREDVERVMGGERADAVVTDPPYGLGKSGIENDGEGEWLDVLKSAMDLCESGIRKFVFCAASPRLWQSAWYVIRPDRILIWHKPWNMMHPSLGVAWHFEPCLFVCGSGNSKKNIGDVITASAIWRKNDPENQPHPTQKPVQLMAHLVDTCGAIVYEPFAGSGTTIVACQQLGRKCRAIEISPAYVAVILERMKTAFPLLEIVKLDT